jgi:hypothetical protein
MGQSRPAGPVPPTPRCLLHPDSDPNRATAQYVAMGQKATLASSDLRIAPVPAIQWERRCPRQDDAELGELAVFRVDVN